ncbi:hypothetical protein Tco_1415906, partial [Tanacetum coccineum]
MDEQAFDNELDTERDKKDGENRYSIDSPKKKVEEDTNFNSTNSETKDNSSDLSRPPGFEFMKKSFSSSSNCSTSFARRRKNDIKGEKIDKFASMDIIQKAHVKWDIEGDENSKFFHGLINQKRRNQMINGIMVEGNWITNPCLIKDAFLQFYKRKFQAQDSQVMFSNLPHSHSLNCMDRETLERQVTLEEIKEAVWDCGSSKAPGPDGYSFAFVKKYWGTIQKDLYDFVNLFFASCVMPNGVNSSFFTLIPKVNNPTYKIIAKILANRLSKVIDKIVSKEQSAFIDGRQILDGPVILSEIIE